jgi:hypothetical protein
MRAGSLGLLRLPERDFAAGGRGEDTAPTGATLGRLEEN